MLLAGIVTRSRRVNIWQATIRLVVLAGALPHNWW